MSRRQTHGRDKNVVASRVSLSASKHQEQSGERVLQITYRETGSQRWHWSITVQIALVIVAAVVFLEALIRLISTGMTHP